MNTSVMFLFLSVSIWQQSPNPTTNDTHKHTDTDQTNTLLGANVGQCVNWGVSKAARWLARSIRSSRIDFNFFNFLFLSLHSVNCLSSAYHFFAHCSPLAFDLIPHHSCRLCRSNFRVKMKFDQRIKIAYVPCVMCLRLFEQSTLFILFGWLMNVGNRPFAYASASSTSRAWGSCHGEEPEGRVALMRAAPLILTILTLTINSHISLVRSFSLSLGHLLVHIRRHHQFGLATNSLLRQRPHGPGMLACSWPHPKYCCMCCLEQLVATLCCTRVRIFFRSYATEVLPGAQLNYRVFSLWAKCDARSVFPRDSFI